MNTRFSNFRRLGARAGLAVLAAALLVGGAAWHGAALNAQPAVSTPTATTPITHAIAGGRDSYADIVDVVSPAVVTIRTEGKARMSPTDFQGSDDDMLRRFFGDQFGFGGRGQQPQRPRTFKQRGLGSGVVVTT